MPWSRDSSHFTLVCVCLCVRSGGEQLEGQQESPGAGVSSGASSGGRQVPLWLSAPGKTFREALRPMSLGPLKTPSPTGVPGEPDQQDELVQPGLCIRGELGAAAARHHAPGSAHGHQHLHRDPHTAL